MTYISDTIEHQGVPWLEFRVEPEIPQRIHISFTPTFPNDEYAYCPPRFVYCEQVVLAHQWEHCFQHQLDFESECPIYRVAAMELVEVSLTRTHLYEAPHWRYGIREAKGTRELRWFSEDELMALSEIENNEDSF